MEAGPEMDRLVHDRVMGLCVRTLPPIPAFDRSAPLDLGPGSIHLVQGLPARLQDVPAYSTDIADAWLVVKRMQSTTRHFSLFYCETRCEWLCRIDKARCVEDAARFKAWAEEAPLAICRAALKAVGA